MTELIKKIKPPKKWVFPVLIITGCIIGLLAFILYTSNAVSYLSDKPETCINCHVMVPQYATWQHSSHRENANCNDCHVPHNNVFNKYYFKAKDGLRHATMFTLRMEPQVIFIHEAGQKVVHDNCVRCHSELLTDTKLDTQTNFKHYEKSERECWDCHREVPHGRVNSLTSTPYARTPQESPKTPEWLNKKSKK
ncbi:MAG: cytochrome c nitrite reductase small subunit [Bacteroidales bacterium]|nr:cytochrome c nitrite reductase small subunit [Bacteroidales bacterium]